MNYRRVLAHVAWPATIFTVINISLYLILLASLPDHPSAPPPIAGATAEEQAGPVVRRGFALGKQYRSTLLASHSDSWLAVSRRFEDGEAWEAVHARWANEDRIWRDEPFVRLIEPEIGKILGPDAEDEGRRRAVVLFVRAFAAGLKDTGH